MRTVCASRWFLLRLTICAWLAVPAGTTAAALTGCGSSNVSLLLSVIPPRAGWRRHVTFAVLLLGFVLVNVATAQPSTAVGVAAPPAHDIVAVDVSLSMQATNVAPTGIGAACPDANHLLPHTLSILPAAVRAATNAVSTECSYRSSSPAARPARRSRGLLRAHLTTNVIAYGRWYCDMTHRRTVAARCRGSCAQPWCSRR